MPVITTGNSVCDYTTLPPIPTTSTTSKKSTKTTKTTTHGPFTTSYVDGDVIVCASSTLSYFQYSTETFTYTKCAGSSTTIKTGTHSTTTTSSATASPTAQLVISYLTNFYSYWAFFTPDMGSDFNVCDGSIGEIEASGSIKVTDPPYPDGTKKLDFKVHGMKDCVYEGTEKEPGTFTCPDLDKTVQCEAYPDSKVLDCYEAVTVDMYNVKVLCRW
ncbi:hypothetical protein ASPCADRAFT_409444 [Aspergillus carbonarius ITEM 5010]|uniref:Uncharacterized protein n=1 Tax=Aspergillus carbonarius (strain ITEM 5010) TaxID=602072 RepID=A0A1R3RAE2_ASPC5|nr:hypothetical protein ASPCADRAFT_409444 [Aspergillus carbonarius ITEM 5010]